MITKIEAARIATSAAIPVVLTTAAEVSAAMRGELVGTFYGPVSLARR